MNQLLLVEDDPLFALDVKMMIEEYYPSAKITYVESAENARKHLNNEWDVALLDVVLESDRAGIELSGELRQRNVPVIFMTSFQRLDLFRSALKTEPYNYLHKPFSGLELKQAIDLTLIHSGRKREFEDDRFLFFKDVNRVLIKVAIHDVYLIESCGNYCHFHTREARYTHRMALKNFADFVPPAFFIRINRNNVVNIRFVDKVDTKENTVCVAGNVLPVSRRYRSGLLEAISHVGKTA